MLFIITNVYSITYFVLFVKLVLYELYRYQKCKRPDHPIKKTQVPRSQAPQGCNLEELGAGRQKSACPHVYDGTFTSCAAKLDTDNKLYLSTTKQFYKLIKKKSA